MILLEFISKVAFMTAAQNKLITFKAFFLSF